MSNKIRKNLQQGFTVSEIIIVAPIVLATLTGLVTSIVFITTTILQLSKANYQRQEILSALDTIAEDLSVNAEVVDKSFTPITPQGKNDDETKFETNSLVLVIKRPLLSSHLKNKHKDLILTNSVENDCSGPLDPAMINVVYFLKDKTLWRRVLLPNEPTEKTYCLNSNKIEINNLKDRPSCSATDNPICLAKDSKILTEVADFKIKALNKKLPEITIKVKDQAITKKVFVDYPAHP